MRIGIGIDTGGTYTDAVLYDMESDAVLASAKSLTTREDLSRGIGGALDGLPRDMMQKAAVVALSTTLATNACVENKGGRAKLLLVNIPQKTLEWVGGDYGLKGDGSVRCVGAGGTLDGSVVAEPDWDALLKDSDAWLEDAEGLGVVELYAMNNGAVVEKKAKSLFGAKYPFPVICGHELFSDLNSIKRGASTLLNARLVPILRDFLSAIASALAERGVNAETVVVRSDATIMSDTFAKLRPVETVLCGPAASVLGGTRLTGEENCVIVDMGGTTTDISLVKDGRPVSEKDGVRVGDWRTYVKGVFIDTFALGGDSAVRMKEGHIALNARRVTPLCVASSRWPGVKDALRDLIERAPTHTKPLHEFFYAVRDITGDTRFTDRERRFVAALGNAPVILSDAAAAIGESASTLSVDRLEDEGVVMRCGFTPTDVMHIRGDFSGFDTEASRLAAAYFAMTLNGRTPEDADIDALCEDVYDLVKRTMYENIVRILLRDKYPKKFAEGLDKQLLGLIRDSWDMVKAGGTPFFRADFSTGASLVGIGAPTHVFLPDVAHALGTRCVVPAFAGVANAVGAITGRVSATVTVQIRPNYHAFGVDGYTVFGSENMRAETLDEAVRIATEDAERSAREEATRRGITGEMRVVTETLSATSRAKEGQSLDMGTRVVAVATTA